MTTGEQLLGNIPNRSRIEEPIFKSGILTGSQILEEVKKKNIIITPFDKSLINPNSYNVRLHPQLKVYTDYRLDSRATNETKETIIPESGLTLQPGELYIGRTVERTASDIFVPLLDGRSSSGRLGIFIHATAGFGDIGFDGTWTLEIMVVKPVVVYPNMEIGQVAWFTPYGKRDIKYDGRYQGQIEATASRMEMDKKVYL